MNIFFNPSRGSSPKLNRALDIFPVSHIRLPMGGGKPDDNL
jgi:hypothetical protein